MHACVCVNLGDPGSNATAPAAKQGANEQKDLLRVWPDGYITTQFICLTSIYIYIYMLYIYKKRPPPRGQTGTVLLNCFTSTKEKKYKY